MTLAHCGGVKPCWCPSFSSDCFITTPYTIATWVIMIAIAVASIVLIIYIIKSTFFMRNIDIDKEEKERTLKKQKYFFTFACAFSSSQLIVRFILGKFDNSLIFYVILLSICIGAFWIWSIKQKRLSKN